MRLRATKLITISSSYRKSVPWTPAALGSSLALWLDAADASTITLNGSTVSQWNDKSGNNQNASQAVAANQPAYTANGQNGKPVLTFDGLNDFLALPTGFLNSAGNFSVAMITRGSDQQNNAIFGPIHTNSVGLELVYTSVVSFPTLLRINGSNRVTSGLWRTDNTAGITTVSASASATAGWFNGASVFSGPGNSALNFNGVYTLGRYSNGFNAAMVMPEFIITNTALSTTDRQRLEGYLAGKWGLQADLPANHPYKSSPPTA